VNVLQAAARRPTPPITKVVIKFVTAMVMAFVVVATIGFADGESASAAPVDPGNSEPTVVLSTSEAEPDELIDVTISGFTSRTVTVTVCGNQALRGSGDCNMAASESTRINDDGSPRFVKLIVSPPPMPCPCLIRVSSPTNDQAATAPITLTGHPIAEPVSLADPGLPLVVTVRADENPNGAAHSVRSSLGGPTAYDVTITVRNAGAQAVDGVSVSATAERSAGRVLAVIDVPSPGTIAAGATWEQTVSAELPPPVWGDVQWVVDVSGSETTIVATDETHHLPLMLIVSVVTLMLVALALSVRLVIRIRTRRRESSDADQILLKTRRDGANDPGPIELLGEARPAMRQHELV